MLVDENERPNNSQKNLILTAGILLIRLQLLENVVKLCCGFMNVDDKHATLENLFSEDENKRHYTLGRLIVLLKEPSCFKVSFVDRLDAFVKNRNKFIHRLWPSYEIYSLDEDILSETYTSIATFLDQMDIETTFLTQVFIGFQYAIGAHIAKQEGKLDQFESDPEYSNMKIHAPLFLSVVK